MLPRPLVDPASPARVRHWSLPLLVVLALLLQSGTGRAQEQAPAEQAATPATTAPAAPTDYSKPMGPPDPYNRGTPRGSIYGFMTAADAGDFEKAANHLDLRRLHSDAQEAAGPQLARELKTVIDRSLVLDYENFAANNAGTPKDGLSSWRDRLGTITAEDGRQIDLLLQRVPRTKDSVRIWKVSATTVDQVPALYQEFGYGVLEQYLPPVFFEVSLLALELWQWIGLLLAVFLAWLFSWLFATILLKLLGYITARASLDDRLVHLMRNPVRILLAVLLFHLLTLPLALPLAAQDRLLGAEQALVVIAVAWLLIQLIDLTALSMQQRIERYGDRASAALVSAGSKTAKVAIVALASLFMLDNLGFNVAALIAGLGVGGIAIALAAQKTVEHLFGGVSLIADQPVRVGDFCRFGDQVGTVEEIGLRSTRIRTLDRTLITIPNGDFSNLQLENYAHRDQIRLHTVLGLRYETRPEQLRYVLARLRELLLAHPKIDPDPARVRFVGFGAYSLDLEVYAYARTTDWNEFLQIREDLFLRMVDVVEEAGSGFAFPSSTTYIGRDHGLDEEQARAAHERVEEWRDAAQLPFPDFSPERQAELEDTLDWPPEGSTGRPRGGPPVMGTDEP